MILSKKKLNPKVKQMHHSFEIIDSDLTNKYDHCKKKKTQTK